MALMFFPLAKDPGKEKRKNVRKLAAKLQENSGISLA
jgi:hypothetical protein